MRSPADMTIIQIELTNACVRDCSNCTRLCGHYDKPFFLEFEAFKQAVKSLDGFNGMAGLMGGEPTLHPQFKKFTKYLAANYGVNEILERGRKPITDFSKYISDELLKVKKKGRCLCSTLGKGYYNNFEIIQETFHYQLLNDHQHSGDHQGILISRKDVGVPDDLWFPMRDACWLQNNWSASITPKGAFFCEVAATLDMLFNGPGGWPVEPGWWKRKPEEFGKQLDWCEMCGIAIKGPLTSAKDECDDISPSILAKLEKTKSPKVIAGKYKIFNPRNLKLEGSEYTSGKPFYLPEGDKNERVNSSNRSVHPRNLNGLMLCDSINELNTNKIEILRAQLDSMMVAVVQEPSLEEERYLEKINVQYHVVRGLTFGDIIRNGIDVLNIKDWIVLLGSQSLIPLNWRNTIINTVFNPGSFYLFREDISLEEQAELVSKSIKCNQSQRDLSSFSMFNVKAESFNKLNMDSVKSLKEMESSWENGKTFTLISNK